MRECVYTSQVVTAFKKGVNEAGHSSQSGRALLVLFSQAVEKIGKNLEGGSRATSKVQQDQDKEDLALIKCGLPREEVSYSPKNSFIIHQR